jgi:hypothetical protein
MEFSAAAALEAGIDSSLILNFMAKKKLLGWVEGCRRQSGRW